MTEVIIAVVGGAVSGAFFGGLITIWAVSKVSKVIDDTQAGLEMIENFMSRTGARLARVEMQGSIAQAIKGEVDVDMTFVEEHLPEDTFDMLDDLEEDSGYPKSNSGSAD